MADVQFPRIGEEFVGRYRIETVIGSGGFSQVYRARQTDLGRDVAIKVLKPVTDPTKSAEEQLSKFEQVARRFVREAKLISRLKDRNTVVMYDYGRTDADLLYMVLEYVDGITIGELLMTTGPLEPSRVVKILRQALQSLHEAHSMDVLHRDIKPGNIMVYDHVGRADLVKVLDFGIAKTVDSGSGSTDSNTNSDVTADGVLVGTPRYMSPEQIRGKQLGPSSDIYSLGLVAYEMLMGVKAVNADSSLRIIARHLDTDPILVPLDLALPLPLRQIVNKMLLKNPVDRYQTCDEVLTDLEHWDDVTVLPDVNDPTMTVDATGVSNLDMEPPPVAQRPRWLAIGIVALLVLIGGMLGLQMLSTGENADAEPAPLPAIVAVEQTTEPADAVGAAVPDLGGGPVRAKATAIAATARIAAEQAAQATAELGETAPTEAPKKRRVKRPTPPPAQPTKVETPAEKPAKVKTKLKAFDLQNY